MDVLIGFLKVISMIVMCFGLMFSVIGFMSECKRTERPVLSVFIYVTLLGGAMIILFFL